MKGVVAVAGSPALLLVTVPFAVTAAEYPVTGMVLKVDRSRNTFVASIQAIPGFMPAMAMPFEVRRVKTSTAWCLAPPSNSLSSSRAIRHMPSASVSSVTKALSRIPGGQPPEAAHADCEHQLFEKVLTIETSCPTSG